MIDKQDWQMYWRPTGPINVKNEAIWLDFSMKHLIQDDKNAEAVSRLTLWTGATGTTVS